MSRSATATDSKSNHRSIDWIPLTSSVACVLVASAAIYFAPTSASESINHLFNLLTGRLGGVFIILAFVLLALLIGLALSPYRSISFGSGPPRYSAISWAGMLFSTGIGTAVLYWGTTEWIGYYLSPPFEATPRSLVAHQWAMSYGMFHWGLFGWGFYAFPAVCLCHAYYVRREQSPSLANACVPVLGDRATRWPGKIVNAVFMIGLIGSASTGLGLTTPLITESASQFLGIEPSFRLTVIAVVLVIGLIAASVSLGLDRGIKRLSNINLGLMFLVLAVIFLAGPTKHITLQGWESLQFMFRKTLPMAGIHYPAENRAFTESWTIFYWAWWLGFGPFVGIFICKISQGRTLAQVIWGVLGFGTLGCTLCFIILGGYASYLELELGTGIIDTYNTNRHAAVVQVITSLPLGKAILPIFFALCASFAATTYDSASYTLALAATPDLKPEEDPPRWHRVLWAIVIGILPLAILSIDQQTEVLVALQTASVLVAVPMLAIILLMAISLLIALRNPPIESERIGTVPKRER